MAGDINDFMLVKKFWWIALKQLDLIQPAEAGLLGQSGSLRNFKFGLQLNGLLRKFYSTSTHALAPEDCAKA